MPARPRPHRRRWAHAAVALATVAGMAAWAPSAWAMPAAEPATVTLSPTDVGIYLYPDQVNGAHELASWTGGRGFAPVPVTHGGSVTFQLPPQLESAEPPLTAELELSPDHTTAPTRTYRSDSAVPADLLPLTDLGSGRYRVDLPADDGSNGPAGRLVLGPLRSTTPGTEVVDPEPSLRSVDPAAWALDFSAAAPASVELTSQLIGTSVLGCDPASGADLYGCPVAATVAERGVLRVVLPVDSSLVALGLSDLTRSAYSVTPYDASGRLATVDERIGLAPAISADGGTATLALPPDVGLGRYLLGVGVMDGGGRIFAVTTTNVEVVARANPGLRSDTGWIEEPGSASSTPWVVLGSSMVLLAAGVAGGALRAGRRSATQE